jgi:hypothetical protein
MSYCIVAPYRNRGAHLARWVDHYSKILPEVPLFVIEQDDDKHFNRAKLFNCFFLEEGHKYDYAIYHDVDMYLMSRTNPSEAFSYPVNPTHLASYISQFNQGPRRNPDTWKESYPVYFGGVCALSKDQMNECNGWDNDIWGWGYEDDAMRKRLDKSGKSIDRRKCYFMCEDHPREFAISEMKNSKEVLLNTDLTKGLSTCVYTVTGREKFDKYELIKVSL